MTMKIDLTQPTIKVENAKGVSYTGKITKFTFIGSGASIDFMTKDNVLIMGIHVPDAVVPNVIDRMLNHRFEDLTITCMQNADGTGEIDTTICDVGKEDKNTTPIYYAIAGRVKSVLTYGKDSGEDERALVEISTLDTPMKFWIREDRSITKREVFFMIRELEFIEENNEELDNPLFIYLYHIDGEGLVLDGFCPYKMRGILNKNGHPLSEVSNSIPVYAKDLKKIHEDYKILKEDKYETVIYGYIQAISYEDFLSGYFTLTVLDVYNTTHTVVMPHTFESLGKFLFKHLIDRSGKGGKYGFIVTRIRNDPKVNLTGLFKD